MRPRADSKRGRQSDTSGMPRVLRVSEPDRSQLEQRAVTPRGLAKVEPTLTDVARRFAM
jgi:hypothetical protein